MYILSNKDLLLYRVKISRALRIFCEDRIRSFGKYVVKGAKLKCSCGDQECSLQPINHDSKIKGKEQANILDFAPLVNVPPFGMCKRLAEKLIPLFLKNSEN